GDGEVDAVHVVFAGEETYPYDPTKGIFWSHMFATLVAQGTYRTWYYMLTPEYSDKKDDKIGDVGGLCHEFGHILGAPDFYDKNYERTGGNYPGTGAWDVMASGDHNFNVGKDGKQKGGNCPAHHNPFTKIYIYGWISPTELITQKRIISPIDKDKLYTLKPINSTKDVYIMPTGTSDEFFLFENKAKLGFNSGCPLSTKQGSLLIYHIHKDIEGSIPLTINDVNIRHPQKCYIVNRSATMNPDRTVESYNGGRPAGSNTESLWWYPGPSFANNIFFTATSVPSATSWNGEATGANICFIHRDSDTIKFVVNPQIVDSLDIVTKSTTYNVSNCDLAKSEGATIKWSYTYIPNTALEARQTASPIIVSNDSNWPFTIKRGQYPVFENVAGLRDDYVLRTRALDFDSKIVGSGIINRPINVTYKYFTGTIILKATITDGKSSYVIVKTIKLEDSTPNKAPALARATSDESEENGQQEQQNQDTYRLVYENPVIANSANICVEKFEDGVFVPYEGTYTLTIVGDRTGMIQYPAQTQPYCAIECGNLPTGVYQLILQVDGQVAATSKMLKLY
ncbi:MAG: immune inhibitor A, partial [Paludibacteraceae bacterium]|nr:immune inhibitor A [Paludibacteraceae bacterium]